MKKILFALMACTLIFSGCKRPDYKNVLRLHVIGNSNSAFDQAVKLKVKDEVSAIMAKRGIATYEEAISYAKDNQAEIVAIADKVLSDSGADYRADIDIGTYHFPKKQYGNYTFKEGNYNAVRLKLGKAKGENWWCVMFPPICFIDSGGEGFDIANEENVVFKSLLSTIIDS